MSASRNHVATPMAEVRCLERGDQSGENWGVSSAEALRSYLQDMESAMAIVNGDYDGDDIDRWELNDDRQDLIDGPMMAHDVLQDAVSGWALDVDLLSRRSLGVDDGPQLEQVELLLTCGGPTVTLILDLRSETVRLDRRWGGDSSNAECFHEDAVELMARFVEYFYGLELDR